jgi:hypothetical protein
VNGIWVGHRPGSLGRIFTGSYSLPPSLVAIWSFTVRVCFLSTASIPFPQIEGPTTHLLLHISPFSTMPLRNKPQWLPRVEVNMGVVLSSGRSKIKSSRGNFQSYTRGTSVPCVKLEATHLTNRCCGQHVHTVSVAWCKSTRAGATTVVASDTAH